MSFVLAAAGREIERVLCLPTMLTSSGIIMLSLSSLCFAVSVPFIDICLFSSTLIASRSFSPSISCTIRMPVFLQHDDGDDGAGDDGDDNGGGDGADDDGDDEDDDGDADGVGDDDGTIPCGCFTFS